MLDFGCGSGTFSGRFLTAAGFAPDCLSLSLVEPVADSRSSAPAALRQFSSQPIGAFAELLAEATAAFHLILVNHCLC